MIAEAEYIRHILPNHFYCLSRFNGVYCYTKDLKYEMPLDIWVRFNDMLKVKYGTRLVDIVAPEKIAHNFIKNHTEFTVVLRP